MGGQSVSITQKVEGCKPKDLIGIPWLLAFALRADGWYLRNDILWEENVVAVLDKLERFSGLFKSITMDNGSEFLSGSLIERSIRLPDKQRTKVYYAHPYSAWERGWNENANKLIRRFIPKGTDINDYSDDDIKRIEWWINNYPRRIFGYKTSKEIAVSLVA